MKKPESFEKRCGKYLFEQHQKISSLREKEEITVTTTSAKIRSSSKEEFIDLPSLHSSLKNDEALSFLCDEEKYKLLEKLTEDLNIKNEVKNFFITRTVIDSNFNKINNTDDDIFDFKTKKFTESILNQCEEDFKNANENNNKCDKKDKLEIIMSEPKNLIIIKSLIYLNKDDILTDYKNFDRRNPDLNKSKYEEDNKFEKNLYSRIEDRIREYLNKIKLDKISQLRDIDSIYLKKIIEFPKKSEKYKYICMKAIIIGVLNLIIDFIGKERFKLQEVQKTEDLDKCDFIIEIYDKYELIKKISSLIEKDFLIFINDFKEENNFYFNLIDLITDLFWDYVFRINVINQFFTYNFGNEKIIKNFM